MSRFQWRVAWCLVTLLAVAVPDAWAQQGREPPRIGYVWPAGGRQGETFEVTVGGQYLADTAEMYLSGEGAQTELVDYTRPLTPKELTQIREIFEEARKKARADAVGGREPPQPVIRRLFMEMAKEKGITDKQVEAFNRFRQQRSDPKRQLNPQLSESVKIRVTLAADAEPGMRELRLMTRSGLSSPLRFHVGGLPEYLESEPNDRISDSTAVPSLPAVLNGQIMPGDVDRFRIKARKGQRLVVDVSARELIPYLADAVPGWFQAVAVLYDADGRQVAYADDYRFDPDPVLLYEVPSDGDYILEIRDSIYRGREDFVYRVTVGELPFVSGVFPMGAQRGERTAVTVEGWNLPPDQRTLDLLPDKVGIQPVRVRGLAQTSNAVPLAVGDLPESREREPNDDAPGAGKLTLPLVVNGRIDRPGDWDVFRFQARAGDEIVAEVHARRLGSPLDSLLKVTDPAGGVLAVADDHEDKGAGLLTHHADSVLAMSIPRTGDYLLWLGDAQRQGGQAYCYRLRVSHRRPDFELRVVPSAVNARGGESVLVTVHAVRRDGFFGDVELRLKDAPEGFSLGGGWVPAGQEKVRVTLTVPSQGQQRLTRLCLEGYAAVNGREIRREAVPADDMMQAFAYHHLVPAETWTVAIEPARWNRPTWAAVADGPVKLKAGGTTPVRVRVPARTPAGQVRLELSEPPEGISIQKVAPALGSVDVILRADGEKAKAGLKGNLIINVFIEREPPQQESGQPQRQAQRTAVGVLPAVPFEVVGG